MLNKKASDAKSEENTESSENTEIGEKREKKEFTLFKKELKKVRTVMQVFADSPEKADYLANRLTEFEREFDLSSYEIRKLPSPITDAYYVFCLTELGKFDKYFGLYTEEERAFLEDQELSADIEKPENAGENRIPETEFEPENYDGKAKRLFGGSHYQNLLALHYLLTYCRVENNNTAKSDFASFLTGYSKNTLRHNLSNVHWKKNTNGTAWEDDMRAVKKQFERLGLDEIVKMIDNDLSF